MNRARLFALIGFNVLAVAAISSLAEAAARAPRPETVSACQGKKADDACTTTRGTRQTHGKCTSVAGVLACRRERAPSAARVEACKGKADGNPCRAQVGKRVVEGACKLDKSQALVCRR